MENGKRNSCSWLVARAGGQNRNPKRTRSRATNTILALVIFFVLAVAALPVILFLAMVAADWAGPLYGAEHPYKDLRCLHYGNDYRNPCRETINPPAAPSDVIVIVPAPAPQRRDGKSHIPDFKVKRPGEKK